MSNKTREQVALRFEPDILSLMKGRAQAQNRSFNSYILHLALEDLKAADIFPTVSIDEMSDDIIKMAGHAGKNTMPSDKELEEDPRLAAIWER